MDSLADFFAASSKNQKKKTHIKELFRVAKLEERYRRGELGMFTLLQMWTLLITNITTETEAVVSIANRGGEAAAESEDEEDDAGRYYHHNIGVSGIATPDTMISPREPAHFLRQDGPSAESYGAFNPINSVPMSNFKRYSNAHSHLPPTPEESGHYSMPTTESFASEHSPVEYHPGGLGLHDLSRRQSWQSTSFDSHHQLPPVQNVWHGQGTMASPIQIGSYPNWSSQAPGISLPPMQLMMADPQAYNDGVFRQMDNASQQQQTS